MKRHAISTVVAAAAVVVLLCAAEGRAADIHVSGQIVGLGDEIDPGDFKITPGGILISRGHVGYELLNGDFAPQILVSSTLVLDITTGEGILFGHVEWEDPDLPGSGFRGPFTGKVSGMFGQGQGRFDGKWTLRGYGDYQGRSARIDNYGPFSGEPQVYEGVIQVPNGF
jgi:hypothetical protein